MKRRGFLGLIGGAAVAGPAAAKNAVLSVGNTSNAMGLGVGSMGMNAFSPRDSMPSGQGIFGSFDRVAQLKKWIKGEEEPDPDPYDLARVRHHIMEQRVNQLNSISGATKLRIMRRESTIIEREKQKRYWWEEILQAEKNSL